MLGTLGDRARFSMRASVGKIKNTVLRGPRTRQPGREAPRQYTWSKIGA